MAQHVVVGRLAPSPTGYLHLGNAWSFLWAWLWAHSLGGRVVLRMEDIDPARSRMEYAQAIFDDLHWLGLEHDEHVLWQSSRHAEYDSALKTLEKTGHTYPCFCTRKELRTLAGAPHVDDVGAPYPGTCRYLRNEERAQKEAQGRRACVRMRCPLEGRTSFHDAIYGKQEFFWENLGGDFALRRSDGVIAYQLAVVLDDAAQGVSHVLRGSDILASTPRQIWLQSLLCLPGVHYAHVPLLLDACGERLAKRHHSLTLRALRERGVSAKHVLALLAMLAGWRRSMSPIDAKQLIPYFHLQSCEASLKGIKVEQAHMDMLLHGTCRVRV